MQFKTKELEDLAKQILDRAVRRQRPLGTRPPLLQRLKGLARLRRPRLPRV